MLGVVRTCILSFSYIPGMEYTCDLQDKLHEFLCNLISEDYFENCNDFNFHDIFDSNIYLGDSEDE